MRIAGRHVGRNLRSERGAILVHVAAAFAGLTAFSVLVVDLGAVWVARRQAQNAADASALSAAVSLAYGNPTDTSAATSAAAAIAGAHTVWGEPVVLPSDMVDYIPCPATGLDPVPSQCIRVDVDRGGAPLPVYFAALVGASATTVRATATATIVAANSTPCLAPFAIIDRWTENVPVPGAWTPDDRYDAYQVSLPLTPLVPADVYLPPDAGGVGTGFTVSGDVGRQVSVSLVDQVAVLDPITGGVRGNWFVPLDLTRASGSPIPEDRYVENITSCRNVPFASGDSVTAGEFSAALTASGVEALVARDPGATWDPGLGQVVGSSFPVSPRIVPLALLSPDNMAQIIVQVRGGAPPAFNVPVVNVVGFFVDRFEGDTLYGVIVPMAGTYDSSRPRLTEDSAFLRTVTLVR